MKRLLILAALCCLGALGVAQAASASTLTVTVTTPDQATYTHTYDVTIACGTGTFSGSGSYDGFDTNETISGTISGGTITGHSLYGGPFLPGYTYDFTGNVAPNGTFSGSGSDSEGTTFDPVTGTGAVVPACPPPVARTKAQCKDGGYKSVTRANGSSFKNQGDCVSYVENGK